MNKETILQANRSYPNWPLVKTHIIEKGEMKSGAYHVSNGIYYIVKGVEIITKTRITKELVIGFKTSCTEAVPLRISSSIESYSFHAFTSGYFLYYFKSNPMPDIHTLVSYHFEILKPHFEDITIMLIGEQIKSL